MVATARRHASSPLSLLISGVVVTGLGLALVALTKVLSDEGPKGGLPDLHRRRCPDPMARRWS